MKDHDERHSERDFWREWRDEQHHYAHEHHHEWRTNDWRTDTDQDKQVWREFFYNMMGDWPENHWIFGSRRFSPWQQGQDSFNPFVANLLSKGGGLLPLYILLLLSQKPRYGNELMDILAKRTGGQWVSNPGAIYPLLALLERKGFIEGRWEDPDRRTIRIYSLKKEGNDEIAKIKAIVLPKLRETVEVLENLMQDMEGNPSDEPLSNGPANGHDTTHQDN
jgi:PadR family transcriptional regulator, regulatory protein PadR